jgi:cytochrome c556
MKALVAVALIMAGTSAVAAESEQPKKEKKICKRMVGKSHSRLGSNRVCKTAAEWDAAAVAAEDDAAAIGVMSREAGVPSNSGGLGMGQPQ